MNFKGNPVFILLTLLSIFNYVSAGQISGSIKQYNTELTSATPVSGADVQCYDYDPFNADDSMTSGKTTSSGSYWMSYSTRAYKWWRCGWDCGTKNVSFFSLLPTCYYNFSFQWRLILFTTITGSKT